MAEPVIVAATRSPIGKATKGSLAQLRPDDLAADVVAAVLGQVPQLDAGEIEDLMLGCGRPGGEQGYNMGRVVSVLAGLADVPGTTITRYCASSLMTIRMAAHAIKAGEGDAYIAAGVECASRFDKGTSDEVPGTHNRRFAEAEARTAGRTEGGAASWSPPDGLPDIYMAMGQTAENVAQLQNVSRADMDAFAAESQQRAVEATKSGVFEREITPITLGNGNVVATDDSPRPGTTAAKLAELDPVFRPDGRVTAGNSCPLNDGAAAVVVMSDQRARELGITPLARIVASSISALDPEIMGLAPIEASRRVLRRAGMTLDDIDLVELNEAFAAQVIPCMRALGIDRDRLNVHGGAIALGHPFGMTGARIMTTLLNALRTRDATFGLETMCTRGGQGMAMIVERLS